MAKQVDEYEAKVTVDATGAERTVSSLGKDLDALAQHPYDVKVETNADASVDDVHRLGQELQGAAEKAAALGHDTVTVRIQSDNIDQVKSDFQELGAEITTINDTTVDVKINTGELASAGQQIEGLGTHFSDIKTKASTMFDGFGTGKFTGALNDVGQLLGSLGGQLGSFGSQAGALLGAFSGLGAAGLGLGAVIAPLLGGLSEMGQDAKAVKEATDAMTASLLAAKDATADIVGQQVQDKMKGLGDSFYKFGISTGQMSKAITGTSGDFLDFYNNIGKGMDIGKGAGDQISETNTKIRLSAGQLRDAWIESTATATSFALATGDVTAEQIEAANKSSLNADQQKQLNDQLADGVLTTDEVKAATFDYGQVLTNTNQASKDAADAAKEQAKQALAQRDNLIDLGFAAQQMIDHWDHASASASALGGVFQKQSQQLFGIHQTYADVTEGIDGLVGQLQKAPQAFKDTNDHLTTFSQTGRDVMDTLQGLNQNIGANFQAILQSGGTYDDVRAKAASYREELTKQFDALGITKDEQQAYLTQLGLTPDQVNTDITLTGQAEAQQQLQSLQQFTDDLPPEVKTEYIADVSKGDYESAVNLLLEAADVPPVVYDTTVGDNQAEVTLMATANGDYQAQVDIGGEAGTFNATMDDVEKGSYETTIDIGGEPTPAYVSISKVEDGSYHATVTVGGNTAPLSGAISAQDGRSITVNVHPNFANLFGLLPGKMAGGYIPRTGLYRMNEAGGETVLLPRGAEVLTAGQTMQDQGGTTINHYHQYTIAVNVPLGGNPVAVGRAIQDALDASERASGSRKRRVA